MNEMDSSARSPLGAILAIVGGALLAVGSFLAWAEVSGGGTSVTAKGVDGSDGYITLAAGAVALLAGIAMTRQGRRMLAILAILAGIVGGGVGVYDALTAKDSVLDAAAEELAPTFGASADQVRAALDEAIDAGQLSISISIGLYVVIAGGILAVIGGIASTRGSDARSTATVAPIGMASAAPPPPIATGGGDAPPAPTPPATGAPPTDEGPA